MYVHACLRIGVRVSVCVSVGVRVRSADQLRSHALGLSVLLHTSAGRHAVVVL